MIEQQRLTIRAELARWMGIPESEWTATCWAQRHIVDGISEDSYCRDCDGLVMNQSKMPPDPFTNAADKDALVEWLAADLRAGDNLSRWYRFCETLVASVIGHDRLAVCDWEECLLAAMTAPLETITLAACKALGIGEEE